MPRCEMNLLTAFHHCNYFLQVLSLRKKNGIVAVSDACQVRSPILSTLAWHDFLSLFISLSLPFSLYSSRSFYSSPSLSHSLFLSLTLSFSHSLSLSFYHSHSFSLSITLSLSLSLSLSLALPFSLITHCFTIFNADMIYSCTVASERSSIPLLIK